MVPSAICLVILTRSCNPGSRNQPGGAAPLMQTLLPTRRAGGGKRGGLRIIYYWAPREQAFYLLYAYTKSEQGDLTAAQTRQLSRVVREEFK